MNEGPEQRGSKQPIEARGFTCKILISTTSSSLGLVPTKRVCVTAFATLSIADAADSPWVSKGHEDFTAEREREARESTDR